MPNVRFKVEGTGSSAKKVEIALDDTFDAGVKALLDAASLQAHPETWISLNKKEPLRSRAGERFFSVIRPGDLLWIMAPSFPSERPAPEPQVADTPNACLSEEYTVDQRQSDSMMALAQHIANMQSAVSVGAIAACLVHCAAVDIGFQISTGSNEAVIQACIEAGDRGGMWRQQYSNQNLYGAASITASVFEMAGSQLVYAHIPGSSYSVRQQIVPNGILELPGTSQMSQTTVLASLEPIYSSIKSRMMVWAANALLLCNSKPQQWGLLALPTEALTNVLSNLGYADVVVFSSVSRRTKSVANERVVWECLLKREFSQDAPAEKDPQEMFKQAVADRKRRREAMQANMHRPGGYRRDPHFAPAPRLPPQLSGVVGGDYDRLPPGMAAGAVPGQFLAHNSFNIPGMGMQQRRGPDEFAGRMGRVARREAGIGGGLGGSTFGIGGRGSGGNGGFGGGVHGPFGGRPF